MRLAAVALFAAIELGGAFGAAGATVEAIDAQSMTVEISVEVTVSAQAVVAHLTLPGDQPQVISLLDRGGGVFGIRTELEHKNFIVVFEVLGPEGALSEPRTLIELGADLGMGGDPAPPSDSDGLGPETRQFGWLALALAAASLSALAFWALGGDDRGKAAEAASEEE